MLGWSINGSISSLDKQIAVRELVHNWLEGWGIDSATICNIWWSLKTVVIDVIGPFLVFYPRMLPTAPIRGMLVVLTTV